MAVNSPPVDDRTTVELFQTPQDVPVEILAHEFLILHGGGIVNPWGPTFTMTAAIGANEVGAELPLVYVMLNPFSQALFQVGVVKIRQLINPGELLLSAMPQAPGVCPTALLLSQLLLADSVDPLSILGQYLARCESGSLTLDFVRRFQGDPVARVKSEMKDATARIQAGRTNAKQDCPEPRQLSADEGRELAQLQVTTLSWENEWKAFAQCWHESVEMSPIKNMAVPFDNIFPIWSKAVDSSQAVLRELAKASEH